MTQLGFSTRRGPDCFVLIGQVTTLFGLSARAIRFYEECGLLRVDRDHLNRRLYDDEARNRLQVIALLRRAGVSIPHIRRVLGDLTAPERSAGGLRAALQLRQAALEQELKELREAAEWVEDAISGGRLTLTAA